MNETPRWSQTCPAGHFSRVRATTRPTTCPDCGATYPEPDQGASTSHVTDTGDRSHQDRPGARGRKRPSGDAATFTDGDGR